MAIAVPSNSTTSSPAAPQERRRHPRFAVGDSAKLTFGSSVEEGFVQVQLVDVSRGGVGVLCPVSVGMGQSVRLDLPGLIIFGEGRNCGRNKDGMYRVGIEITTVVARRNPDTGNPSISEGFPAVDILDLFQKRREALDRSTHFWLAVLVVILALLAGVALRNVSGGHQEPRRIAYVVMGEAPLESRSTMIVDSKN